MLQLGKTGKFVKIETEVTARRLKVQVLCPQTDIKLRKKIFTNKYITEI